MADAVREVSDEVLPANAGRIQVKIVEHAQPEHAVIEEAEQGYDLVVIGASQEWGLESRAVGIRPERIIQECPASLLIVRQHLPTAGVATAPVVEGRVKVIPGETQDTG
jgi:nucleotide-binding universal stress UspA family protein